MSPVSAFAGILGPKNYYECILEKLPGVDMDRAAYQIDHACRDQFPGKEQPKKKKGWLKNTTVADCIEKNTKRTLSPVAINIISNACRSIYPVN